ncbi:Sec-independent protein translocase protein TatB [Photobacterium sp. ZSDE20]|uniref:Sec-independent protein translocase protein TatB n=1 Tax=Photobacterium pectinilyticum TaxID=2906793 RepID=A0ABT1N518_9GAMM|nr:Sec-independent protein translocase protein TatB [Photobacterium sp. ZSDE20]MCQ1059824.1 Sec-independent protein translocase protein TatB [Photobacterium sp. ZSDE20]MDD1826324.1 Sec-independent protein translocase protein TatB [Photobacterium sp. ZSDE20]
MFDFGFWEIILIGVLGLIVLGPEKLPKAIDTVVNTISNLKSMANSLNDELNKELRIKELQQSVDKINSINFEKIPDDIKECISDIEKSTQGLTIKNTNVIKDQSSKVV